MPLLRRIFVRERIVSVADLVRTRAAGLPGLVLGCVKLVPRAASAADREIPHRADRERSQHIEAFQSMIRRKTVIPALACRCISGQWLWPVFDFGQYLGMLCRLVRRSVSPDGIAHRSAGALERRGTRHEGRFVSLPQILLQPMSHSGTHVEHAGKFDRPHRLSLRICHPAGCCTDARR